MSDRVALKIAIDLMHVPSQVRLVRSEPLPEGVLILLRIAADDEEAVNTAIEFTGRSPEVLRRAATFFIEQILFAPNSSSYRVLGLSPEAGAGELRRNLALLLKWLHPDLDPQGERTIFIGRVTAAWNNLKTPERRAIYDAQLRQADEKSKSYANGNKLRTSRQGGRKQSTGGLPPRKSNAKRVPGYRAERLRFFRRALSALLHRPAH